ncbi:unnamed protein product [Trifolium pratense]|uniref:Uncharacterized protein n=1 Tax=Trifolium pratense TaxID=57577 RepID=A0ACB0LIA7_TRIPR|nr:unnamed protein product [Trifolium pratense]
MLHKRYQFFSIINVFSISIHLSLLGSHSLLVSLTLVNKLQFIDYVIRSSILFDSLSYLGLGTDNALGNIENNQNCNVSRNLCLLGIFDFLDV